MSDTDPLPPALVADYLAGLANTSATIDRLVAALPSDPARSTAELRRIAHQLRGSGGAYGFPAVTTAAGEVEDAPPETLAAAATRLTALLRAESKRAAHRVLIVDDDPVMAQVLASLVPDGGRIARLAATAAEADAMIQAERFDLVLLDLFLPDEDGRRLLARWRATPATAATPVFVLSARLGPEIKTECFALGADAYFEKPVDPAMIAAAVASRLARQAPDPAPTAPAPGPSASGGMAAPAQVLIADDDPLIASIVTHRLGKAGHTVRHVSDGAAVLAALDGQRPDLLILDIKMPEMDGLEVLRRIRAAPTPRPLPVIILTALSNEADVVRGFGLGADDYLVKPFSPTELSVRVERLLRRR